MREETEFGLVEVGAIDAGAPPRAPAAIPEEMQLRPVMPDAWCRRCDATHEQGRCPGALETTGPEKHVWKAVAATESGRRLVHGVLLAPAGGMWRARILTYPRILWLHPGRRVTMKFVAADPTSAVRKARAFIEEHCERNGQELVPDVNPGDAAELSRSTAYRVDPRKIQVLNVGYRRNGEAGYRDARTGDVSRTGLFLVTDEELAPGPRISIKIEIGPCEVPMTAKVRWARPTAGPDRPRGVGVEFEKVPAIYRDFIERLP